MEKADSGRDYRYMLTKRVVIGLFLVSLFATVTNLIPLSISFTLLVILLPVLLWRFFKEPVEPVLILLLCMYIYYLLSALLYSPETLLEVDFYRRDGNFFATFMPMLILGLIPLSIPLEKVIKIFVPWSAVFLLGAYLLLPAEAPHLHHLSFIAHNAAGGFVSVVLALCIGQALQRGSWVYIPMCIVLAFLLFETGSRGSMLAVVIALVQVLVLKERWNKLVVAGAVLAMVALLAFTYPAWIESGKPYEYQPGAELLHNFRSHTIVTRSNYLWPRALDNFLKSPIFGQGFGSYNDVPYEFTDYGFAVLNTNRNVINDDAHAHHSFLHLMSETGLIGLGLMVVFLVMLHRLLRTANLPPGAALGLQIAFWVIIWSSFTEHRLTTPSQVLSFSILVGFVLASVRESRVQAGGVVLEGTPAVGDSG
ncbi:MAG: O-antigen ligase family protein [Anaerolineales bacterium]|nr:O-antigen ligase family protein [Anaerolineales bacterium]